jgi:CRISPR-associated protein Cas5d
MSMNNHRVRVKVSGNFACFSRPEMKVERVSYEMITPSAARGVLDAILWKPEMRWHILKVEVLKPIRFQALKRNEIQSKITISGPQGINTWRADTSKYQPQSAGAGSNEATPRNTLALKDVAYIIEAEPIIFDPSGNNPPQKYIEMLNRRVEKGQCFHRPCLGCREFAADFELPDGKEQPIEDTRDMGLMLYDIIFDPAGGNNQPVFFHAVMKKGILDTCIHHALTDESLRKEVLSCSCKH